MGRNARDKGLTDSGKGLEEQSPVIWWQKRSMVCRSLLILNKGPKGIIIETGAKLVGHVSEK